MVPSMSRKTSPTLSEFRRWTERACRENKISREPNKRTKMPSQKRQFGDMGEKMASDYISSKGYQVIDKNYRKPWGEIDLVSKKDGMVTFFEVKTRDTKNTEHYLAEYSINYLKKKKLQKICETYLAEKRYPYNQKWQIDVITVLVDKSSKKAKIKHIENAVWEQTY